MEFITYASNGIQLKFDNVNGKLMKVIYREFIINMVSPVWRIEIKNSGKVNIVTIDDQMSFYHKITGNSLILSWKNDAYKVKVTINEDYSKITWGIDVNSLIKDNCISKVIFPVIGNIKTISHDGEEDYLILPWQNGWLIRNPINTFLNKENAIPFWAGRGGSKYENEYPAQYSYQFTAYYSPHKYGFYFCTEDGDAYIKTMGYYSRSGNCFDFMVTNYPENMGSTTEYHMPYKFTFRMFKGDWQTAAAMYREWAIMQQWCPSRLIDRNLPKNLIKADLWCINHTNYNLGTRTQEYFDTSMEMKEKLHCNLALHWYGWNMGEHDLNYPEYISQDLEGWTEQLTIWNDEFSSRGIVKISYVNARLWDAKTRSWTNENAEAGAIKNEKYQIPDESWNPKALLKPMCPSTSLWKGKVKDFGSSFINEYKFDGLYIDQVASYNATLCFDSSHPHPAGGGKWWNASYHEMVTGLRNRVGEEKILTSESCCESYIDLFDLFLILDTNLQKYFLFTEYDYCESIPLFNMIYGDYALSYGSICRFSDTLEEFEFNFMRNLLWGILPTVEGVDMDQLNNGSSSEYLDILKKGVDFFKENKELILYGRLTEIPQYSCKLMSINWIGMGKNISKEFPCIYATIWKNVDNQIYCLAYNFNKCNEDINIKNIPIALKAKEIKIIKIV